jgi:hypothetical protein
MPGVSTPLFRFNVIRSLTAPKLIRKPTYSFNHPAAVKTECDLRQAANVRIMIALQLNRLLTSWFQIASCERQLSITHTGKCGARIGCVNISMPTPMIRASRSRMKLGRNLRVRRHAPHESRGFGSSKGTLFWRETRFVLQDSGVPHEKLHLGGAHGGGTVFGC